MTTIAQAVQYAQSLVKEGKCAEAEAVCAQILNVAPDYCDALFLVGVIGMRQNQPHVASEAFRGCLRIKPNMPESHNNLGVILAKEKVRDEALHHFDLALSVRPAYTDAAVNRARLLQELGRVEEAAEQLQYFLDRDPNNANLHVEIGYAFMRLGEFERATSHNATACQLVESHAEAHWNLAMCRLTLGDFENGWKEYEWRWKCSLFASCAPAFDFPRWKGESVQGKRILLHAEQGFGDTIQFIRFVSMLQNLGAHVVVHCHKKLIKLLSRCANIHEIIPIGQPIPDCDFHESMMSLPTNLKVSLDSIPKEVPYLAADRVLVEHWRNELKDLDGFRVGIAWQGSGQYQYDAQRSFPLECFEAIASIPGIRLISLQKGPGVEQLKSISDRFAVVDLGERLDRGDDAFLDTAAVMASLDLVISCDTAICHLAGALGLPVWLGLAKVADWRWLLKRSDSPWYPSMRLFRQNDMGNWWPVFETMAIELKKQLLKEKAIESNVVPEQG